MNRFVVTDLPLAGLKRIERQSLDDSRGFLSRLFCANELAAAGWTKPIMQINHTFTTQRGTVRGLHFQQPPYLEMKLVSCIRGEIWDVAVDLRAHSPTFLRWSAECLSADNHRALLIPEGFAHGFQTLSDNVEVLYCCSTAHNAVAEAGLSVSDQKLAITWPLEISKISQRDQSHPLLDARFTGISLA